MSLPLKLACSLALVASLSACSDEPLGPEVAVVEIQSELAFTPGSWDVRSQRSDANPALGRIVPSISLAKEKEDLPSLVMAPPCEVAIPLGETTPRSALLAQVAIDRKAAETLGGVGFDQPVRIAFEVELDGERVWDGELELPAGAGEGAGWLSVGDPEKGLPVAGHEELVLRTRLVGEPDIRVPLKAGFGRLQVVEHHTMNLTPASPARPNVIVVVMDTLRIDRTSSGDYRHDTTPRLAEFAAEGTEWTNGYTTCSWTWPSTASMFTGLLPEEHGVTGTGSSYLASDLDTLAEVMQRAGMATGAFVGNPLIVPSQNFDQGFQTFHGTRAGVFVDGKDLVPGALEWLRANQDNRFFMYLHMVDPHVPYDPDPEVVARFGMQRPKAWTDNALSDIAATMLRGGAYDERGNSDYDRWIPKSVQEYMQTAYDEVVWTGDKWFGAVLDELDALGLDENTVVVFTADHGEELLDHGMVQHSHSLYRELVNVPLVLRGPGVPKGVRVETPVSNRSLFETLQALATDFEPTAHTGVLLHRPDDAPSQPVYFSTIMGYWNGIIHNTVYGVRDGDWVLHFAPDGGPWGTSLEQRQAQDSLDSKVRLFNVREDPREQNDLAASEPARVATLLRLIQRRLAESSARALPDTLASGEGTMDMLKAIGYLDGHE